jgi:histidinol phosphatase-like PHP family hydrolase
MKKCTLLLSFITVLCFGGQQEIPFRLNDLHIHLKGGFTIEDAIAKSAKENIGYGIVTNCGLGFPVHSEKQIDSVINSLRKYPQFYAGMQAEGREWVTLFSKEARAKFDYVFTDGMTFTDEKGRRNRIWLPEETWIDDEQKFMDYYVKTIVGILNNEPIDIYVNPTFLPTPMDKRYSYFWTDERMNVVIEAAKKRHIAIEINNRYNIPSEAFIRKAKAAGLMFTVGSNNADRDFSGAAYAKEMIRKCGLTEKDFWLPPAKNGLRQQARTVLTINADQFMINGKLTYQGRYWKGNKIEGLLLNSRMVQGIFDDLNPKTVNDWAYADTKKWSADRNTDEFVANMKLWRDQGLLSFTINLQGGSPQGYSKAQPWYNSAYREDGSLRPEYMARLEKILNKADELGMVPIVGLFYFGQDQNLRDEAAVKNGVNNVADWLFGKGYRNILIEVNNECNISYHHEILMPGRVHELIDMVRQKTHDGLRFYVGTSYGGGAIPKPNVVRSSDFILIHGNGVSSPDSIAAMVKKTRAVQGYTPKPVLFNEDDHFNFDKDWNNFTAAVTNYASWGYFDYRMQNESYENGYQSVPVDWGINSERKKGFFKLLKEIAGY